MSRVEVTIKSGCKTWSRTRGRDAIVESATSRARVAQSPGRYADIQMGRRDDLGKSQVDLRPAENTVVMRCYPFVCRQRTRRRECVKVYPGGFA